MNRPSPRFRVPLSEDMIAALYDTLTELKYSSGLSTHCNEAYKKIHLEYLKIDAGLKKPDYVATGRIDPKIKLMDSLGVTEEERIAATVSAEIKFDAECLAGTHKVITGEEISWTKFVNQAIAEAGEVNISKETDRNLLILGNDNDSNQDAQLNDLLGKL